MTGSFDANGAIDTTNSLIIVCLGKKRSGKSVMGLLLFRSFPGDKVVIDVAGDDGPVGEDVHELTGTVDDLPRRWPEHLREDGKPMTLRYAPDAGSPTFLEDIDAVVGLAYQHSSVEKPACLLVHEMGRVAESNRTPPHTMRVLQHGRHRRLTAIFCMPRPLTVNTLVLGQADLVYAFELPAPADRQRVADNIGWDPVSFTEGMQQLKPHEYLRFDANEPKPDSDDPEDDDRLLHMPALPADDVAAVLRWAKGDTRRPDPQPRPRARA